MEDNIRVLCQKLIEADDIAKSFRTVAVELRAAGSGFLDKRLPKSAASTCHLNLPARDCSSVGPDDVHKAGPAADR